MRLSNSDMQQGPGVYTLWVGGQETGDDRKDTCDTQVGGGPCVESVYVGTETSGNQVSGGPRVGAGAVAGVREGAR